ncbi:MAG: hypothetical protein DRH90_23105 [Deltaproteobacteria bacterium]|nr:MAG: hypothetical protein DRH90_23105 [Deltaproteobacteria bacterium]
MKIFDSRFIPIIQAQGLFNLTTCYARHKGHKVFLISRRPTQTDTDKHLFRQTDMNFNFFRKIKIHHCSTKTVMAFGQFSHCYLRSIFFEIYILTSQILTAQQNVE